MWTLMIHSFTCCDHTNYAPDAWGLALIEATWRGLNINRFKPLLVHHDRISVSLVPHTGQTVQSCMSAHFLWSPVRERDARCGVGQQDSRMDMLREIGFQRLCFSEGVKCAASHQSDSWKKGAATRTKPSQLCFFLGFCPTRSDISHTLCTGMT